MWGASKDFEFIPKISQTAPLCSVKVNLLSNVTPKSLKLVTTFTLISTVSLFTILELIAISLGSLTLLFVTNMKNVLDQLMSSVFKLAPLKESL
jgi:hypothetical protein